MKVVHIHIGDIFASSEPAEVETVLGSCIAVCLFDPIAQVGGMNHYMLPKGNPDDPQPSRFGEHAIHGLIEQICGKGGKKERLEAKIFGAASVLDMDESWICVPCINRKFARNYLANFHIPLISERLGGNLPLKVRMFTHTGVVLVRALPRSLAREVAIPKLTLAERWKWFETLGDPLPREPVA
jgi:chemotaxis receptor (MCP) glutamine deamidase CheD